MITVRSNAATVFDSLRKKLLAIKSTEQTMRAIATNVRAEMKHRIHVQGIASDGNKIGTYSDAYMKVRTGQYSNAGRYSRGKNAGQTKNSGVFTKGKNKGNPRPQYNRGPDRTVIASLTRQMENDLVIVPTRTGYGLGYNNQENYKKVGYLEDTYRKKIFAMTAGERTMAIETARAEIDRINGTGR